MKFEIKNRFSGAVQFTAEIDCAKDEQTSIKIGLAVKWAIKNKANLSCSDLSGADLSGSNLRGSDLRGANLRGANLSYSDLSGSNLSYSDLRGANLRGADLSGANLRGADLRGANLRGANLSGANLSGADLSGADLSGSNLRGSDLSGSNLDFSCWPLWCGSLGVKADVRIAAQLAYHFCRIDFGKGKGTQTARDAQKALKYLANTFHRANECGKIK